jgi:hypothetical protein
MIGKYMRTKTLAVLLAASAVPALADEGTAEQQRDCVIDVITWCGEHIFAPDRDKKIGDCLWERRTQISSACRSHLRPPKNSAPT